MKLIEKIKFSVVTIVYNGESFIESTLMSTINQTYDNLEYIIIDGNSTDRTSEIVRRYSKNITHHICENDLGIYDAMNKGLALCSGDYVIFMNGGDCFSSNDILKNINERVQNIDDVDFIYGDSYVERADEILRYKKARNDSFRWYGMFTNHQSMFYKLSIIRDKKIVFDLSYKIAADYKFTLEFLKYTRKSCYLDMSICIFSCGGISITQRDKGLSEAQRARREVLNHNIIQFTLYTTLVVPTFEK